MAEDSPVHTRIKTLFTGGALVSDGASPFYAKGTPIDNAFYPFFESRTRQLVVLTPDNDPTTMGLLHDSLTQAVSQVFMGKLSLPRLEAWSTVAYSPYDQTFQGYKGEPREELRIPGMVYLGLATISPAMASRTKELDEVLALAHASTALTLIGCSPSIEKTA